MPAGTVGGCADRPYPDRAPQPGVKVDARSERWREHRKKVRAEIVDAAFRAIDRLGPELSLREIAEEAGTAKPKIYRHFTDKSDLFQAIGERLRDMLWAAIFPTIDLASDPAREVIRRSVEQYVHLVDQHPNVCRFLIQGRFAEQSESTMRAHQRGPRDHVGDGRTCSTTNCARWNSTARPSSWPRSRRSAPPPRRPTGGWAPTVDSPRRMPPDEFVAHMTTIMLGSIYGTCELLGIKIDPDLPLHEGVRRRETVA